jgi:hypothetical protein
MNAQNYRLLEKQLCAAEEVYFNQNAFGQRAQDIRRELNNLITKVVAERIRAEEAERQRENQAPLS